MLDLCFTPSQPLKTNVLFCSLFHSMFYLSSLSLRWEEVCLLLTLDVLLHHSLAESLVYHLRHVSTCGTCLLSLISETYWSGRSLTTCVHLGMWWSGEVDEVHYWKSPMWIAVNFTQKAMFSWGVPLAVLAVWFYIYLMLTTFMLSLNELFVPTKWKHHALVLMPRWRNWS